MQSSCTRRIVRQKAPNTERVGGWSLANRPSLIPPLKDGSAQSPPRLQITTLQAGGRPDMMSQKKWRETKQQPSRARSGHQVSCCLTSLRHPIRSPCSSSIPSYTRTRVRNVPPLSPSCLHLPCSRLDRGTRTDSLRRAGESRS